MVYLKDELGEQCINFQSGVYILRLGKSIGYCKFDTVTNV
jgi:hypothetical protein